MSKPIKILISVIMLLFGFVFADCLYGFTIGGEMNFAFAIIVGAVGILLSFASILIIFGKEKSSNTRDIFFAILIVFLVLCVFSYKPLNKISGNNEYTEKIVEVVEVEGTGKGSFPIIDPEYFVTVKNDNGAIYDVEEYNPVIEYDEGDEVIIREYNGGFNLKYYTIAVNQDKK